MEEKMKHLIEKQDAKEMNFDAEKDYKVFENFNEKKQTATCKVSRIGDELYAEFEVKKPIITITGFPAIGYKKDNNTGKMTLMSVSICCTPNIDESIPQITIKRNYN